MSSVKAQNYSVNGFSMKLYSKLAKARPRENLFYSPTSIYVAMAMTYAGTKANTAKELEQAMDWDSPSTVHETIKKLQQALLPSSDTSGIELRLANRLWVQKGFAILNEFTEVLKNCYQAELGAEDFAKNANKARLAINRWVEEKTNDKIKDLIKESVLTSDSRLVITNAVYFKGLWQEQFSKSRTRDWDFKVSKTETTKVKLMNVTADFLYAKNESLSCQVLTLPYQQQKVAMVILLPEEVDGLAKLEEKINNNHLRECNQMMTKQEVFVSLPKFKMNCQFSLVEVLKQLGICDLFMQNEADLSRISGNLDLFVSEVVHQAFVDVNEEGTEAAAATAVVLNFCCLSEKEPPQFLADHPFLFYIQHCESGAILFAGRVLNPASN